MCVAYPVQTLYGEETVSQKIGWLIQCNQAEQQQSQNDNAHFFCLVFFVTYVDGY